VTDRRVTIVSGASRGIGRQLARAFGEQGDLVVLCARTDLEETAAEVQAAGGEPMPVPADVADPAEVAAMASTVLGRHGRVDVLVNNAGVTGPSGRLWESNEQEWLATFEINVFGVYRMTRAFLPSMIERRSGAVINIGSISGKRPLYGRSSYTSTKAALVGFTRTLALEAGPYGVRVNLLSPGFVAGPRFDWLVAAQATARGVTEDEVRFELVGQAPLQRAVDAREVADAAVFLASDAARGITGAELNVNAGLAMY
jgi:NAD(P)-dependent dehydrogenase (short-subunit alcohol dehydrogenase family)